MFKEAVESMRKISNKKKEMNDKLGSAPSHEMIQEAVENVQEFFAPDQVLTFEDAWKFIGLDIQDAGNHQGLLFYANKSNYHSRLIDTNPTVVMKDGGKIASNSLSAHTKAESEVLAKEALEFYAEPKNHARPHPHAEPSLVEKDAGAKAREWLENK